jgi:hypothetical protein
MNIRGWFASSKRSRIYHTRPYTPRNRREDSAFHRQMLIPGFDQSALERAVVVFIGWRPRLLACSGHYPGRSAFLGAL